MKYILLVTLLSASLSMNAQHNKGSFEVGVGGLPILYPDNSQPTGFSLRANAGYFLIDNLSIGLMPFVGKVGDINSLGASVYARYYLTQQRLSIFLEAAGGFGSLTYGNTPEFDGTMSSFNIGPGVQYELKGKVSLEFLMQYARLRNESFPESTLTGNTVIPTFGINFRIGNE